MNLSRELQIKEQKAERLKTLREAFEAGYDAAYRRSHPPMGPGSRIPNNSQEAYEQWLEEM